MGRINGITLTIPSFVPETVLAGRVVLPYGICISQTRYAWGGNE
jgi:hypothetical protein